MREGRITLSSKQIEFLEWFTTRSTLESFYTGMSNRILEQGWYSKSNKEYLNYMRSFYIIDYIMRKRNQ